MTPETLTRYYNALGKAMLEVKEEPSYKKLVLRDIDKQIDYAEEIVDELGGSEIVKEKLEALRNKVKEKSKGLEPSRSFFR